MMRSAAGVAFGRVRPLGCAPAVPRRVKGLVAALAGGPPPNVVGPNSDFFATAGLESAYSHVTEDDGDLWPS